MFQIKAFFYRCFIALQEQRDRWMAWCPVPVAAGIGVYFALWFEPPALVGPFFLALVSLMVFIFRRHKLGLVLGVPFLLFVLGFSAAQIRTSSVAAPILYKKTPFPLTLEGYIRSLEKLEKSSRMILEDVTFDKKPQDDMPNRIRIRLKLNDQTQIHAGDRIRVRAMLTPVPSPSLPGAYDFGRQAYFQRIGATGYAVSDVVILEGTTRADVFARWRQQIRERVLAAHLAPQRIEELTLAFMIGETHGLDAEDWRVARDSGIAHLIAISGSHFAMIVGVIFFSVRAILALFPFIALRWPIKKIAAGVGMMGAIMYVFLIGCPIAGQRAAVMSCLALLAIMLDRDPLHLRLVACAALGVLLLEPETLVGPSFQLSFSAVIGLIAFFDATRNYWRNAYREAGAIQRTGLFFLGSLATTLVASIAVMPYALYHFLVDPLLKSWIANFVAVPFTSLVTFPMGLLALLLMPFGLESGPLWVTERSIDLLMSFAKTMSAWQGGTVRLSAWPVEALILITLGLLWAALWSGKIRWLGSMPMVIAVGMIILAPRPDVLVGGQFYLLAATRQMDGSLSFSQGRRDAFTRRVWQERESPFGANLWPEQGVQENLTCNIDDCVYQRNGHKVLLVKTHKALTALDCNNYSVIVTPQDKRPAFFCAAIVIDKWRLYDRGTHEIFLSQGIKPRILTVDSWRGRRPWNVLGRWVVRNMPATYLF